MKNRIRDVTKNCGYRPYNLKPAPLKAKASNSVLIACVLPIVKDKRIVEYRMRSESVEKDNRKLVRQKIATMINKDLDKFKDRLNYSTSN